MRMSQKPGTPYALVIVMTMKEIEAKQNLENRKFEIAKQIRAMLDGLRKEVGATEFDDGDWENQIIELVTG